MSGTSETHGYWVTIGSYQIMLKNIDGELTKGVFDLSTSKNQYLTSTGIDVDGHAQLQVPRTAIPNLTMPAKRSATISGDSGDLDDCPTDGSQMIWASPTQGDGADEITPVVAGQLDEIQAKLNHIAPCSDYASDGCQVTNRLDYDMLARDLDSLVGGLDGLAATAPADVLDRLTETTAAASSMSTAVEAFKSQCIVGPGLPLETPECEQMNSRSPERVSWATRIPATSRPRICLRGESIGTRRTVRRRPRLAPARLAALTPLRRRPDLARAPRTVHLVALPCVRGWDGPRPGTATPSASSSPMQSTCEGLRSARAATD